MKYLIMKCEELSDQYEYDANRSPVTLTNDWQAWYENTQPNYQFEVYKIINNEFTLIKEYETPIKEGMVFAFYPDDSETATAIKKFPGMSRHDTVPEEIMKRIANGEDADEIECLENCGYISWFENNVVYCWTEYYDNRIMNCF